MPHPPLPSRADEFLHRPNPAVIATLRTDGSPHTAATWYDWEGGRVLVNMDVSRRRRAHMQPGARVALTALDKSSWYRHVSVIGRVASLELDRGLAGIDRLARRYTGRPYRRRDSERWNAWIEVDSWHGWTDGVPWDE
jgi:PPOX class probable F420-dependent enzyme